MNAVEFVFKLIEIVALIAIVIVLEKIENKIK